MLEQNIPKKEEKKKSKGWIITGIVVFVIFVIVLLVLAWHKWINFLTTLGIILGTLIIFGIIYGLIALSKRSNPSTFIPILSIDMVQARKMTEKILKERYYEHLGEIEYEGVVGDVYHTKGIGVNYHDRWDILINLRFPQQCQSVLKNASTTSVKNAINNLIAPFQPAQPQQTQQFMPQTQQTPNLPQQQFTTYPEEQAL